MRFKDDVILVVGSATSMGNATVRQRVREGAHGIAFDLREDALEELSEDVMGSSFRRASESVAAMIQNDWTAWSRIWMDKPAPREAC